MPEWNKLFKDEKFHFEEPEETLTKFIDEYIKQGKVLEIGCGRGRNCIYAARKGLQVTGIDISKEPLEFLKSKIEKEKINNLKLKETNMNNLPFEDSVFDAVYTVNVMNHGKIDELKKAFHESFRVLKKGGYYYMHACPEEFEQFVVNENSKEIEPHTFVDIETPDGDLIHHFFTKDEIKNIFNDFEIIKYNIIDKKSKWLHKDVKQLVLIAKKL
jgi:cyclopropane fatty-acyl-phospholipid synthase-like methyltransferase